MFFHAEFFIIIIAKKFPVSISLPDPMAKALRRKESRNYKVMAGTMVVAALFWFAVSMSNSYVAQFTVPLTVVDLPENMALANALPDELQLTLEGTGWQLLVLSIGDQLRVEVPGTSLLQKGKISTLSLMTESFKLPSGIRVLRAYPDELSATFDTYAEKKVPLVLPKMEISFKEGFGLTRDILLEPDSITVSGAERIVRFIDAWTVNYNSYTGISLPVQEEIGLSDSLHGLVRLEPKTVKLTIPVEQLADVQFQNVKVHVNDVPYGKDVLLLNSTIKLYVRGGVNTLSNLDDEDFSAIIDYHSIKSDTTGSVVPRLLIPASITVLRTDPERIRYTVREK